MSDAKFPPYTRPKSTMFPPLSLSPSVEMFVRLTVDKFRELLAHHGHDNLTRTQRLAIRQLRDMKDIVIKPAEKGGGGVMWYFGPLSCMKLRFPGNLMIPIAIKNWTAILPGCSARN